MTDAAKKLLVAEPTGAVFILQDGGFDDEVIDKYRADGNQAAPFDYPSDNIDRIFLHRGRIRERKPMLARINKKRVRANGEDEIVIVGAPLGAAVRVSHGLSSFDAVNDGVIHVTLPLPGRWVIEIEHPAFLPQHFDIIAE